MPTKEQKAEYQRRWYEKNKQRHIENVAARRKEVVTRVKKFVCDLKEKTPCADCGVNYPSYVMDFDHLDDKSYAIANMIGHGYDIPAVQKEIDKCEIVCANCHRIRTHNRKQAPMPERPIGTDS